MGNEQRDAAAAERRRAILTLLASGLRSKQADFTGVKGYEGRVALVHGVVQLYRGKPEIILNEPGQLRSPD